MNKVAFVTGGQQGIGLGIVEALISDGYRVAIASELSKSDPRVAEILSRFDGQVRYYQHDLCNVEDTENLVSSIVLDLGPITTYVSNAGIASPVRGDMLDISIAHFDRVLDINLRGSFFLAQNVARHMLDTPSDAYRSLSFVTSVSAEMVSIERADYCMSKAAASMMAQNFAVRLAPNNIGVFELRPGIIETPMTLGVRDKYTSRIENGLVPAMRWGEPTDIGSVILPLARGQLAFATGNVIAIDGGLSIPRL